MDNISDEPLELNSKEALQAQMDTARRNISETVSNLKTEIGQALDWQTYVRRHPGTCLVSGGLVGLVLGRAMKGAQPSRAKAPRKPLQASTGPEPSLLSSRPEVQESPIDKFATVVMSAALTEAGRVAYGTLRSLAEKKANGKR
jgi:hypothetical protein